MAGGLGREGRVNQGEDPHMHMTITEQLAEALEAALKIADEARKEWDEAPTGMRAGKLLIALSGGLRGYRADIDAIHDTLAAYEASTGYDIENHEASKAETGITISRYIERQRAWSNRTFGVGLRTLGVTKHIEKELQEVRLAPQDLDEWCDIIILALDGAWRAGHSPDEIWTALQRIQMRNFARQWPASVSPDEPVEHVRSAMEANRPTEAR
jgi:hypothetical protein